MAWFLALQTQGQLANQSWVYELQETADVGKIAAELVSSATLDRVVSVPAVLPLGPRRRQTVTLYVRPAAWGIWTFYQLSEEDRRQLAKENPILSALSQVAQQRGQTGPPRQPNPLIRPETGSLG
jgi:hypothetical protein